MRRKLAFGSVLPVWSSTSSIFSEHQHDRARVLGEVRELYYLFAYSLEHTLHQRLRPL